MGTDIHSIIEFQDKDDWYGLSNGEWSILRNYNLFGAIAGICGYRVINPIAPRGLPKNYSSELYSLISYEVIDQENYSSADTISRSVAETWVKSGKSSYCGKFGFEENYVLDPDYHTYGWLTASELQKCITVNDFSKQDLDIDIFIMIEVMNVLGKYYGAENVRFLFWFDN